MLNSIDSIRSLWIAVFFICLIYSIIFFLGLMGMGMAKIDGFIAGAIYLYGIIMLLSPAFLLLSRYLISPSNLRGMITLVFLILSVIPAIYFLVIIIFL